MPSVHRHLPHHYAHRRAIRWSARAHRPARRPPDLSPRSSPQSPPRGSPQSSESPSAALAIHRAPRLRLQHLPQPARRSRHPARRFGRNPRAILQPRNRPRLPPIRHSYRFPRHRHTSSQKCNQSSAAYLAVDPFTRHADQPRLSCAARQSAHHPRRSRLRHPAVPHRPIQLHAVHRAQNCSSPASSQHIRHTAP